MGDTNHTIRLNVDTSALDEALAKARELEAILQRIAPAREVVVTIGHHERIHIGADHKIVRASDLLDRR